MADAEFVFQVYFDRPVGVGEHPGLLQEMDTALEKWGEVAGQVSRTATLTMEIDDAEEEPVVVISAD